MGRKSSASLSGNYKRRKKSVFRQLLLLAWKNLLLRKRHWIITIFEIILPVLLITILLSVRVLPDSVFLPEIINTTTRFNATTEKELRNFTCSNYGSWIDIPINTPNSGPIYEGGVCVVSDQIFPGDQRIFYGPPGNFTKAVAEYVATQLGLMEVPIIGLNKDVLYEVDSLEEMDEAVQTSYFQTNDSWNAYYVGLFFNDTDGDTVPYDLKYELRMNKYWYTEQLYPFLQIPGPRNYPTLLDGISGFYNLDGFTLVQSLVDRFFISTVTGNESYKDNYEIQTQMYPYPPYVQDNGMSQLYGSALPTFIVLSLVLLSPSLIKSVVHEKETGVRELVKLMGMDSWLIWLGWFFHSFIIILTVSAIITIMLKLQLTSQDSGGGLLPAILAYSDGVLVWVLLLLYGISSIAFCFSIATFFSKPTLATTMGILLWLTSYFIPRMIMDYEYNTMTLTPKILSCLLPNMALTWAFRIIAMFEGRTLGVQWYNLWDTGNPRDQLTLGMILLMLLFDTFLFFLITWYVDQVSPGAYGVPEPLYFPFQKSYWFSPKPKNNETNYSGTNEEETQEYFEKEPVGLRPGIIIRNLRKEFSTLGGKKKVAVENVSFTCYEGQCTVLLGHNGAGKTTTMSVLTGVYAPTSGHAEVGGWDIATNLKEAREEVGLCPQHNMLFVDLTVFEHLFFFGRLKGMKSKDARKEARALMSRLELLEKKNMYGSQLSGGMKRKLCLAISLIGGSKIVILDEPSSGLDPESRRWVWDVVQRERGRRTVLVTTHHMEEADVLGDRVAIMASGKVVASGSTLFLKNKFGDGYTLTLMVSEGSNIVKVSDVVTKFLPSATLRTAQGGEVTFKLPPTTAHFAPLLDALSGRKYELGIRHLGLSLTSMEQVFLRVGAVIDGKEVLLESKRYSQPKVNVDGLTNGYSVVSPNDNETYNSQRFLYNSQADVEMRLSGWALLQLRIKALFTKRFIYTKRKWVLLLTQALLPVLVTIMCLAVDASFNETTYQEPPILLNTSIYSPSNYFAQADDDPMLQDLADNYQELFWGPYKVSYTDDLEKSLLEEADRSLFYYRENNICSAEFLAGNDTKTVMRMLYQSVPYHTPGVGMSLVTNALLRYATNSTGASITTNNRPLPPNRSWRVGTDTTSASALVYSMTMPLALAFLSASYLVFPLEERESKAKQVQVMTGAPLWILWFTNFIWDLFAYTISALIVFVTIMIGDSKNYFTVAGAPGALFLLLFMYGWGSIPMAYVFSFPFESSASGFAMLAVVNILAGQIITTAVWALELSGDPKLVMVSDILNGITSVIPTYPASTGFMNLVDVSNFNTQCNIFGEDIKLQLCDTLVNMEFNSRFLICCPQCATVGNKTCFQERRYLQFDKYGMGPDILTLFVNGIIFFFLLLMIEVDNGRTFKRIWWYLKGLCSRGSVSTSDLKPADEDVLAEASLVDTMIRNRLENPDAKDDATLLVSGLTKQFFGSPRPAVNRVSFRVGRGECLGLLGVNGAGKTTTFRMLTGDEKSTFGDAYIDDDVSLKDDTRKFVREIGYCPQFDAILGELTGEEMLTLIGRLRGVSDSRMKHVVSTLITLVGLNECAKRPSTTYSGGNKRKLSTAMALVGSPPLVFLDEPTSGVDPASRRRVWAAVTQAVNNGQSVVLTSHSMEECEALCSRIIIMSSGILRCVGTTGHLKTKFGQGYSLQIKLKTYSQEHGTVGQMIEEETYNARLAELKNVICLRLQGSQLTDEHKGMVAYRIPSSITWGHLFSVMEALKAGQQIESPRRLSTEVPTAPFSSSLVEDYAASDTSLEQVFLSFAREAAETLPQNIPTEVVTKF